MSPQETVTGSPDYSLHQVEGLGGAFLEAQHAIENVIILARRMPPKNSSGDWGRWDYGRGTGQGTLYVPFGSDGIASASLSCGGEIGDDDIARAGFVSAFAFWSGNPSGRMKSEFGVIALPWGEWYDIRGGLKEAPNRLYFFYQEVLGNQMKLEVCGSENLGWWAPDFEGIPAAESKVTIGYHAQMSALLPLGLKFVLKQRQSWGAVASMRV